MGIVNSTRFDRQDEPLVLGRLVPVRREGKKVFARTLRYGEEDTGEAVHLEAGDQLIVAKGDFSINSRQIDEQSVPGLGGYAPVANTVYTWYNIIGGETLEFYLFFFPWRAGLMRHTHYGLGRPRSGNEGKKKAPYLAESVT